jgi:hypothetical protein
MSIDATLASGVEDRRGMDVGFESAPTVDELVDALSR